MKKEFEQRLKKYPLDAKYISILAKELGLKKADEYKLFSIMGREELSANLINANYRDFVHEGDFHDKYFRMNLHMHSVFSDGSLSIENYLEKGQIYADLTAKKNGDLDRIPPLTLALTDHDEIGGHSNILKILINNPEKYKNLRIVLGCEFSFAYRSDEMFNHPFSFEILCYGINPFDKKVINQLSQIKQSREKVLEKMISELSEKFPYVSFDKEEARLTSRNLLKFQGVNTNYGTMRYAMKKAGYPECYDEIYDICFKRFHMEKDDKNKLYNELEEIFDLKTEYNFFGIPHPAKMEIKSKILKQEFISDCNNKSLNPAMEATWRIMSDLLENGIEFSEVFYQSYDGELQEAQKRIMPHNKNYITNNDSEAWIMHYYNFVNNNRLLKSGSHDTHGHEIYKK